MNLATKESIEDLSEPTSFELFQAKLEISNCVHKGRCLVAAQSFNQGDLIVEAPAYELPKCDLDPVRRLDLYKYIFFDPSVYRSHRDHAEPYLVFGPLAFCNHSPCPNAFVQWYKHGSIVTVKLRASDDISKNEEITMRYANIGQYPGASSWEQ
ncbi:SET domain-containing protein [Yoonia sp. BS5-3]|uniref:SET domain-containing protein n=1 Tax=Yoonia phaeophyticola TaxID=3137369 RepID=A0ABZ3IER8_9RHOB